MYDPQSLNRYSFERNSPYNRVDPDGHQSEAGLILGAWALLIVMFIVAYYTQKIEDKVIYEYPDKLRDKLTDNANEEQQDIIDEEGESNSEKTCNEINQCIDKSDDEYKEIDEDTKKQVSIVEPPSGSDNTIKSSSPEERNSNNYRQSQSTTNNKKTKSGETSSGSSFVYDRDTALGFCALNPGKC